MSSFPICSVEELEGALNLYHGTILRDPFYDNSAFKCSAITLKGHRCEASVSSDVIQKGRSVCFRHINQSTSNSFILLMNSVKELTKNKDKVYVAISDYSCDQTFVNFSKEVRRIHRSNPTNLEKPLWFLAIITVIFNVALALDDLVSVRYLLLTVDFLAFECQCKCCKIFMSFQQQNCPLCYNPIFESVTSKLYTDKDILFGLLVKYGYLHKYLPKDLILDIFRIVLFITYPGEEYFRNYERILKDKKNEKRLSLLSSRSERYEKHSSCLGKYNDCISTIDKVRNEEKKALQKEYDRKMKEIDSERVIIKHTLLIDLELDVKKINKGYPQLKPIHNVLVLDEVKKPID